MLKNEVKHEDMVSIMTHLQKYVSMCSKESSVQDPDDNEKYTLVEDTFHYLFGGDQLTVERAYGGKKERKNESRGKYQLDGLVPVVEDWHAKVAELHVHA